MGLLDFVGYTGITFCRRFPVWLCKNFVLGAEVARLNLTAPKQVLGKGKRAQKRTVSNKDVGVYTSQPPSLLTLAGF